MVRGKRKRIRRVESFVVVKPPPPLLAQLTSCFDELPGAAARLVYEREE